MKKYKLPFAVVLITALVYLLAESRHGLLARPFQLKNFLIIGVLVSLSAAIHRKRSLDTPNYIASLSGIPGKASGRIVYMDYIRVLAALLVIAVHVLESTYSQLTPHTPAWETLAFFASLSLCCNLLFMMLSGALLLNGKEEPVLVFYRKRLGKVLVPCFAYYVFYLFYASGLSALYPSNWGTLIRNFISNGSGLTPHFWLAYVILMFYLTAPFFRIMLKHMSDGMLASLVLVIFILHAIFTYLPYLNISFAVSTFLASWESIFILGYFCTRDSSDQYRRLLTGCGILSVLCVIPAVHFMDDFGAVLYNNAPPMMFIACTIFLFFKKRGNTWFRSIPGFLSLIGKYSFSILLIHWLVLYEVVYGLFGMSGLDLGIVGGTIVCIFVTLAVSLVFSVFYDNTVVLCMDYLFQKLTAPLVRSGGSRKKN